MSAKPMTPAKAAAARKRTKKTVAPSVPAVVQKHLISEPGLYPGISHIDYHRDPCPAPSCSASLLAIINESTPAHAWQHHPRLNPHFVEDTSDRARDNMDLGTAAHSMLLRSGSVLRIGPEYPNFRNARARQAREYARSQGAVAVLAKHHARLVAMAATIREEIPTLEEIGDIFDPALKGQPEVTAIWRESGCWCKARADWWIPPLPGRKRWPNGLVVDYKSVSTLASPEAWSKNLYNLGSDFQAVWYPAGFALAAGLIQLPAFRFIVQETQAPFAFTVQALDEIAVEHTTNKIVRAFDQWSTALKTNTFPAYPKRVAYVSPPPWELNRDQRAELAALIMNRPLLEV